MGRLVVLVIYAVACGEEVAVDSVDLVGAHGTVVNVRNGDENHHDKGEDSIEVVGNGADEELNAVYAVNGAADSRRP